MIAMRAPTDAEVEELVTYLGETAEHLGGAAVGVADKYITDGPGYHGKVIAIVWPGGPEIVSTFTWNREGRLEQCQ